MIFYLIYSIIKTQSDFKTNKYYILNNINANSNNNHKSNININKYFLLSSKIWINYLKMYINLK